MFAVIYQFKFPGVSEAKVAAGFCSESLGGKIAEYDFLGLNILISNRRVDCVGTFCNIFRNRITDAVYNINVITGTT